MDLLGEFDAVSSDVAAESMAQTQMHDERRIDLFDAYRSCEDDSPQDMSISDGEYDGDKLDASLQLRECDESSCQQVDESLQDSFSSSLSIDQKRRNIAKGFRINGMQMKDGETGDLLWESESWGSEMWETELEALIPSKILDCRLVVREIDFYSEEEILDLKLVQRVMFQGSCIEEWTFDFGFVIPGSTNSWQQVIKAAKRNKMRNPAILSGNVSIETCFYDGIHFISKSVVRVHYR